LHEAQLCTSRSPKDVALAAIAGATALATTSGRTVVGIIALIAAGLSAVTTTLNAAQPTEQAQAAGNLYLALQPPVALCLLACSPQSRQRTPDVRGRYVG
jgi:hypothetical protein